MIGDILWKLQDMSIHGIFGEKPAMHFYTGWFSFCKTDRKQKLYVRGPNYILAEPNVSKFMLDGGKNSIPL